MKLVNFVLRSLAFIASVAVMLLIVGCCEVGIWTLLTAERTLLTPVMVIGCILGIALTFIGFTRVVKKLGFRLA